MVRPPDVGVGVFVVAHHPHPREVHHGVLHRHFDGLPSARPLPLVQGGGYAERRVIARPDVPEGHPNGKGRAVGVAVGRIAATRRLGHHVKGLEVTVGAVCAKALESHQYHPRVYP